MFSSTPTHRLRSRFAGGFALCVIAASTIAAGIAFGATTAATRGSMLSLTGGEDQNRPEVTLEGNSYVIRDSASGTLVAGGGCTADGDPAVFVTAVRCPASSVALLSIDLMAGDDELMLAVPTATVVRAGAGDDAVAGGPGRDTLDGESGTDDLHGGGGADKLVGGGGDDDLRGGAGPDNVVGSGGDDDVSGGSGANVLNGDAGNDSIGGGPSGDRIDGGKGSDVVKAGAGNDSVSARDRRRDRINCGPGRDTVRADRKDVLRGCERRRVR